jgi:D-beta-D-heptose 7-phosphate kinase / D-beta-D-heptose 1-phosphate adenosyltransferase
MLPDLISHPHTPIFPELIKLLDAVRNLHVIVIGDAMLDSYLEGFSDRLCPEAPVPIVTITDSVYVPGGAANTAVNVHSLGAKVTFLSVIGNDKYGDHLWRSLSELGISTTHLITHPTRQTLSKQRIVAASQILMRVDSGTTNAIDCNTEQALIRELEHLFPKTDAVIVSDYNYGILTDKVINAIAQLQQNHPRVLVVDSKNLTAYRHLNITAVKPNYDQALQLLGIPPIYPRETNSRAEQIKPYGEKLLNLTGAKIAAVTLDTEGAIIFEHGSQPHRTYAQPTHQSRTAGAGDTYSCALTLALATGAPLPVAAEFAATAAAVVVTKEGTTACSAEELREFLCDEARGRGGAGEKKVACVASSPDTQHPATPVCSSRETRPRNWLPYTLSTTKHIPNTNQLLTLVTYYRNIGRKIVFTNGCFDILHAGHISYLNRAKALGDILMIGVNSDGSIRRIKGPSRPINPLEDRIQVLCGLGCVDYLIAFEEDTPCNLIRIVKPDIYVKGSDYTKETLPEAPLVEEYGGVVELLPLVENRSTTRIIQRIFNEMNSRE